MKPNLHNVPSRLYEMALHLLLTGTGPFEGFYLANKKADFRKAVNANASLKISSGVDIDLAFGLAVKTFLQRRPKSGTQETRGWQTEFNKHEMVSVCYDPELIEELFLALDDRIITGLVISQGHLFLFVIQCYKSAGSAANLEFFFDAPIESGSSVKNVVLKKTPISCPVPRRPALPSLLNAVYHCEPLPSQG